MGVKKYKNNNKLIMRFWVALLTGLMIFSGFSSSVKAAEPYTTNFGWGNEEEPRNEWPLDPNLTKSYAGVGTAGFAYNRYYYNDLGRIVIEIELSIFPDDTTTNDFGSNFRTFRAQWDYANIFIDPNLVNMVDEENSFFMMSYPVEAFPITPNSVSLSVATKPEGNNIYKLNIDQVFPNMPTYSDYMKSKLYLVLKESITLDNINEDYAVQLRYTNEENQVYDQKGTKGNQVLGNYYGHVIEHETFDVAANNDDVTLKTMIPFQTASMTNAIPNVVMPPDTMRVVAQSVIYDSVNGTLVVYYRQAPNHYWYTNRYADNGYFLSSWIGIRQVMDSRIYDALKPDADGTVGYMKMFNLNGIGSGWNVTTNININEFSKTQIVGGVSTHSYMMVPRDFKTEITNKAFVPTNQVNNVKNIYLHGHKKEADFVRFIYYVDKNKMDALFEEVNSSSLSLSTSYITDRPTETTQTEYRLTAPYDIVIPKGATIVFDLPRKSRSVFKVGLGNNYERFIGDMKTKRPATEMNNNGVDPSDYGQAYTSAKYFATDGGFVLRVEAGLKISAGEIINLTMFDETSPETVKITVVSGATRRIYTLTKYKVNENRLYTLPNANIRTGVIINRTANTPHVDEFFTDSINITGHSKYPFALVSMRKAVDNEVFKEAYSSTVVEQFYAEGNPTALEGYTFVFDVPNNVEIKKDMAISFSNAATGYFRSTPSTYRAQARVTFDKNDGTDLTEIRIVPMNEKAYNDNGYAGNGFEGPNILWLDTNGNVTDASAAIKYFSDHEGKPIKSQTEIDKRKYYDGEGLTREGYKFLGWSTKQVESMSLETFNSLSNLTSLQQWEEDKNYIFTEQSPIDESRTVYAVWEKQTVTYQFVLHANNGGAEDITYILEIPVGNISNGNTEELTAYLNSAGNILYDLGFVKANHYFVGWAETEEVTSITQVHELYTNHSEIQLTEIESELKLQLRLNEEPASIVTHENPWKTVVNQPINNNGVATLHLYAQYKPLLEMEADIQWFGLGEKEIFEQNPEGYSGTPDPENLHFDRENIAMVLIRTTEGKTLDPTKYEIVEGFYVKDLVYDEVKQKWLWKWQPQEGHDANGRKYSYLMTEFSTQVEEHNEESIINHFNTNRTWTSVYITMIAHSDYLSKYTALSLSKVENNITVKKSYLAVATSNQPTAIQYVNSTEAYSFLLKNFEVSVLPAMINRIQENHTKVVINKPIDGAKYLYLRLETDENVISNSYEFKNVDGNWITNNGSYSITESDDKLTITAFNFEGKAGRRVFALFTFDNYNEDIENYEKYAYKEIQPYVDLPALEEIQQKPHIKDENGNITHNVVSAKIPAGSYAMADYTLGYINGEGDFVAVTDANGPITIKPDDNEKLIFKVPQGQLDADINYIIRGIDPAEAFIDKDFDVPTLDFTAPNITDNSFSIMTGDLIAEDVGKIETDDANAVTSYKITKNNLEVSLPEGINYDTVNNKFYGKTADVIDPALTGEYVITITAEDQFGNVSTGTMTLTINQKQRTDSITKIEQIYNDNDGNAVIVVYGIKDASLKFYSKNEDGSFTEIEIIGSTGSQITSSEDGFILYISQADVRRFNGSKMYVTQTEDGKLESDINDSEAEIIERNNNIKKVTDGGAIIIDNIPPTPLHFITPSPGTDVLKITNVSADEALSDVKDIDRIIIKIGNETCILDRLYDAETGESIGKWYCNKGFTFDETEEELTVIVNPNTGETETKTVGVLNFVLNGAEFEEFQIIEAKYYDYLGNGSAAVSTAVPKLPDPVEPYNMTATNDSNNHPDTTIIKGKADVTATVSVIIAGQTYSVVVDDLGDFTIEVPKQVVGTIINVSSKLNNYTKTAPVTVTDVEADAYQTTVNDIKKPYGRATTAQEVFEAIKILEYPEDGDQPVLNIKQGVTLPNGRKSGEHLVPVIITYPDGSTKTVDVKVTVGVQPHNNKYQPIVENEVVQVGGTIDLTDNITNINNLPFGTIVKDTTVTPIDTNVVGTYIGQLTVTYPDKTKDIVNVTVIVQEEPLKDNEKYTAIGGVVDKNKEETLTEEDIKAAVEITPKPEEGAVVNISITSPLPTTGMDNKVKVLITYSDNTTDVVTVIVNFHAPEVPLAKEKSWSLASLIVTLLSIAAMVVGLLAKTIKTDETGVELVRNKVYKVVTVLFGVATMVYFLATNNLSLPMKLFNETTLISSIMTVVTMASLALGLIWRED